MINTTRIRIPCKWYVDTHYKTGEPLLKCGVADFTLGLGPCGKEVYHLDYGYTEQQVFYVVQTCCDVNGDNREKMSFFYRNEDITGRIEITEK